MWIEIYLSTSGDEIRVRASGSRGERTPEHAIAPELGMDALQTLANKVGRAVRGSKALDPAVVTDAQALYEQIFKGELQNVMARLGEASKDGRLLVRFFLSDPLLQSIPWEVLCRPATNEGFLGTDPKILVARGVTSSDPWEPRDVRGAVRVLAVAPGSDERAFTVLKGALAQPIAAGEIDWLDPITGPDITARALFDRLRRSKSPHILHWFGHGSVDLSGKPVLRVADDEYGGEVWITAEAVARELSAGFSEELRLVILEACEGAKPGALGSAAEIIAKAGADAVVAHLWPVAADVARICSWEIYRSLTAADRTRGDIGASVAAARSTLLPTSAEAFSPILYLRGSDSVIFNFERRRVSRPADKQASKGLAPALQSLLESPFTMVLGDLDDDRAALQQELLQFMKDNGDAAASGLPLPALTQRCLLRFGQEILQSLFQQALTASPQAPPPPLVDALARFIKPGVHITLLWRPYLERAVAERFPERTVFAVQPSLFDPHGKPRVVKRAAGAAAWKMEPILPKRFDLDNEIVILRVYGGYSAEPRPIFSQPALTEDDHIHGLLGADEGSQPPTWLAELLARPRIEPGLFVGLSILEWRHRMLLRWLYDHRPAPKDSFAILAPTVDPSEMEIWDSGGGLPGTGRIPAIIEDPAALASQLEASPRGGES